MGVFFPICPDVSGKCLGQLVEFLYTGELQLTSSSASVLFTAASHLQIQSAMDLCQLYFMDNMVPLHHKPTETPVEEDPVLTSLPATGVQEQMPVQQCTELATNVNALVPSQSNSIVSTDSVEVSNHQQQVGLLEFSYIKSESKIKVFELLLP